MYPKRILTIELSIDHLFSGMCSCSYRDDLVSRAQSLHADRRLSHQVTASPVGQADTFSFAPKKAHTRSSLKSTADALRHGHHLSESDSTSDVMCACDPSMYYKVKLPSLCGEGMVYVIGVSVPITAECLVAPEKFYESLIDTLSIVIKVSVYLLMLVD